MRPSPFAVAFVVSCISTALAQTPVRIADVVYATWLDGGGQPHNLLLDVYVPAVPPPLPQPLVVWVHGGAWTGGSKFPAPATATDLVARGFVVASIDYRLSGTAIWPAQIHDCKAAIRFLRANAATWNVDPDRIGAMGSSAGGHLVAALGTMGGVGPVRIGSFAVDLEGSVGSHAGTSSRVQAVCDQFGPTTMLHAHDFPTFDHDGPGSPESMLLGGPLQQRPEQWATVDPITFLTPDDAPLLVMHGTDDTTVPFHQSELLVDAARAIGLDVTFFAVQNTGHGGPGFQAPDAIAAVQGFFDRTLRLLPDVRVSVQATDANASEAGPDAAVFTIARTGATAAPLTVALWLDGDVTPGDDCELVPLFAAIPAGAASTTVTLSPRDDALVEGPEAAVLTIAARDAYGIDQAAAAAAAVIADDDGAAPVVTLAAIDAVAAETGDGGSFRFTRTGPTTAALLVRYRVSGTAQNGVDVQPLPGTVTIAPGASQATVFVVPRNDLLPEAGETVIARVLADGAYARGASSSAHVVLADDDRPPFRPIVGVLATDPAAGEPASAGAFTLTRTGPTVNPLTVHYGLSGTAAGGADCTIAAAAAVIPAGSAWVRVPLLPIDDAALEGREDVALAIVPDAAYAIGAAARRRLWFADDEAPAPLAAPLWLAVSPLAIAETGAATVGGEAGAWFAVWFATAPGYLPWPPFGTVLLDLQVAFALAGGTLDASGAATFAVRVPDLVELIGIDIDLQAVAASSAPPGIVLSDSVSRRVAGQAPR